VPPSNAHPPSRFPTTTSCPRMADLLLAPQLPLCRRLPNRTKSYTTQVAPRGRRRPLTINSKDNPRIHDRNWVHRLPGLSTEGNAGCSTPKNFGATCRFLDVKSHGISLSRTQGSRRRVRPTKRSSSGTSRARKHRADACGLRPGQRFGRLRREAGAYDCARSGLGAAQLRWPALCSRQSGAGRNGHHTSCSDLTNLRTRAFDPRSISQKVFRSPPPIARRRPPRVAPRRLPTGSLDDPDHLGNGREGQTLTEHAGTWTNTRHLALQWGSSATTSAVPAYRSPRHQQTYALAAGDAGTRSRSGGPRSNAAVRALTRHNVCSTCRRRTPAHRRSPGPAQQGQL